MSRIGVLRLASQRISGSTFTTPVEAARHMLAIQGQDFASLTWSLGLRVPGSTLAQVEAAFATGEIVRAWPMRGTLHATAAEDLPWLVDLLCPRVTDTITARRRKELDLDDRTLARARTIAEKALAGGNHKTREELSALWEARGISTDGQRAYHLLFHLSATKTLCFGPPRSRGKTSLAGPLQTFTLLAEWIKKPRTLDRDEALAELARRYFTSHGPATLTDLIGWTKLTTKDARRALDLASPHLERLDQDGHTYHASPNPNPLPPTSRPPHLPVHLLPGFDEYILGYKDRTAVLDPAHMEKIVPGNNGMFMPTIVSAKDGRVLGTWRRTHKKHQTLVEPLPFAKLRAADMSAFEEAAQNYRRFLARDA